MLSYAVESNSGNSSHVKETIPGIIVLLGAPNSPAGELSGIARERCDLVAEEHRKRPDWLILPTGGHGEHFNTAPEPHFVYATRYLVEQGIGEDSMFSGVSSQNTVEDASMAARRIRSAGVTDVVIVTSDFHMARAEFLFRRELPEIRLDVTGSTTDLPEEELTQLRDHEERALARLCEGV
tara:strand:+ start:4490 stop:5032 length:543 start_codon:yes stop_codon:yes gene_type:complete